MKKIGDKSSILSPITGFRMQKPFRKPTDSSPQGPATTSNNSWTKASLRWRGSIKTGSIGLRSEWLAWEGIGSGIPRVMAENCDVELIDRPDGNQFIARIWRTTQKDETTTQKANEELISATQKEESTTQKSIIATPKPLTDTQKEILEYLHEHPTATRQEVAKVIDNITEDGVKYNIGRLQQYGVLKRVGGRKNGHWEVILQ